MTGAAPLHALGAPGRAMLAQFMARRPLLTFDIDGTLAPIHPQPDGARIPETLQRALARLTTVAEVAILTGRGRDDARRMLAFDAAYVLGNHGIEGLPGWEARTRGLEATARDWRATLAADAALREAEVILEDKRYSLSLHYRHAPDHARAEAAIHARLAALVPAPKVILGKCVVNVLPQEAPNKGEALRALLATLPSGCALYAGDDETDEHVFDLPAELVLGVRVGRRPGSGARLYVDEQAQMLAVVEALGEMAV